MGAQLVFSADKKKLFMDSLAELLATMCTMNNQTSTVGSWTVVELLDISVSVKIRNMA